VGVAIVEMTLMRKRKRNRLEMAKKGTLGMTASLDRCKKETTTVTRKETIVTAIYRVLSALQKRAQIIWASQTILSLMKKLTRTYTNPRKRFSRELLVILIMLWEVWQRDSLKMSIWAITEEEGDL
jgi:hypothetical protein